MDHIEAQIRAKLAQSDDELYSELGERAGEGAFLKDSRLEGRKLLKRIRERAANAICSSARARDLYEHHADAALLVAAILDAVTATLSVLTVSVSPFTVGVLLVRTGIGEICRTAWSEPQAGHD